jgi:hypothetical protein
MGNEPLLILWIAFVLAVMVPSVAKSQCNAPTLTFHSPVLISGTDGQPGAIYLFQNVLPGVDAHIEVLGLYGGATLYNIDDTTGIGYYDAFQPYVGAAPNDTSYIDWKITFKVSGTNDDTTLACLAVTGVDVDGDGAYLQEFIEAATPGSIAVDPATILAVSFDGVRSKAISTIYNIPLIDSTHLEAMFQMNFTNISTLLYRNGAVSTYGAQEIRQTCIYFKPFFHGSTFTILPAKILSFTARSSGEINRLEWSASNENDIRTYIVEKSADGRTWAEIKGVYRGSSAVINDYSVADIEKNPGSTYYRLKQVNARGSFTYSKIIQVNGAISNQQTIAHNTVIRNTLNLQIYGTSRDEYTVEYYTMTGSKIKQDRLSIYPGINSTSVQFPTQLSVGSYFLVIKNNKGQQIYTARLIKT